MTSAFVTSDTWRGYRSRSGDVPVVELVETRDLARPGDVPVVELVETRDLDRLDRRVSHDRQHHRALERRHLLAVLLPLRSLVAQEEVVDVLAQRLGHQ